MDFSKIKQEIDKHGFCMFNNDKLVADSNVYQEELKSIYRTVIDDKGKNRFHFALFRANLYNIGYVESLDADYALYKKFILNNKRAILQTNTLLLREQFDVVFENDSIKNRFDDIVKNKELFLLNSFHYASFKSIFNYLLANDFDVLFLVSNKIIMREQEKAVLLANFYNYLLGTNVRVNFINVEDHTSLLKIVEIANSKNRRKTVVLTYIEGNKGSIPNNKTKSTTDKIEFMEKEMLIKQRVPELAALLKIPLINSIMITKGDKLQLSMNELYDFSGKNKMNCQEVSAMIFKNFEKYITREDIYLWLYIMELHRFFDVKDGQLSQNYVDQLNYEENRFTPIRIDNNEYIFDSKYYLSHRCSVNMKGDLRERVCDLKIKG